MSGFKGSGKASWKGSDSKGSLKGTLRGALKGSLNGTLKGALKGSLKLRNPTFLAGSYYELQYRVHRVPTKKALIGQGKSLHGSFLLGFSLGLGFTLRVLSTYDTYPFPSESFESRGKLRLGQSSNIAISLRRGTREPFRHLSLDSRFQGLGFRVYSQIVFNAKGLFNNKNRETL